MENQKNIDTINNNLSKKLLINKITQNEIANFEIANKINLTSEKSNELLNKTINLEKKWVSNLNLIKESKMEIVI